MQKLSFDNRDCRVLICRDISWIQDNASLKADNKMLNVMTSTISHEMVTPLKCMISLTDLVQKNQKKDSADAKNLNIVRNTAEILLNQMQGSLDTSLLKAGQFQPKLAPAFIISEVVKNSCELFKVQAKLRGVSIVLETNGNADRLVMVDKHRTQQILINLLQNALKFSKQKDKITVGIQSVVLEDDDGNETISYFIKVKD